MPGHPRLTLGTAIGTAISIIIRTLSLGHYVSLKDAIFETGASGVQRKSLKSFICVGV